MCGGVLDKRSGSITSPGFPTPYPLNRDCTWILKTRPGMRYVINIQTLQIENNTDCNHDYLSVSLFIFFQLS